MIVILKASEYICVLSILLCALNAGFLLLLSSLSDCRARKGLGSVGRMIGAVSLWFGLAVSLCGVSVFMYQVYLWLTSGKWMHIALLELAIRLLPGSTASWLRHPRYLHELSDLIIGLLRHTPLFVLIIVLGGVLIYAERLYDAFWETTKRDCG